jgi:predicted transposase YbfD/YdcC
MLCGEKGWDDMHFWAVQRRRWLARFLDLRNGVPSADCLRRVLSALDPAAFRLSFQTWAQAICADIPPEQIAIDGKTIRGASRRCPSPLHIVRAFVVEKGLVLGQMSTSEKSNEMTAIPELLEQLVIRGALVSIDAMGAQHRIVEKIIDKGGDYLIGIKDNQPSLHAELQQELSEKQPIKPSPRFDEQHNTGHGRKEIRRTWVKSDVGKLPVCSTWKSAATMIRIESTRITKKGTSVENRYYLSSRKLTAKQAAAFVRGHWSIENECHYILDVTMGEDSSPIAEKVAAENLSTIRSVLLSKLRDCPVPVPGLENKKLSMRQKMKFAGWNRTVLVEFAKSFFSPS